MTHSILSRRESPLATVSESWNDQSWRYSSVFTHTAADVRRSSGGYDWSRWRFSSRCPLDPGFIKPLDWRSIKHFGQQWTTSLLLFTREQLSNEADRIDISCYRNGRDISYSKLHLNRPYLQDREHRYVAAPGGLYRSPTSGSKGAAGG